MGAGNWVDVGAELDLRDKPIARVEAEGLALALSFADGRFAAISAKCVHKGGPLDQGVLDGGCIVCPWHQWKYDRVTGRLPGSPSGVVVYDVEVRDGRVWVDVASGRDEVVVQTAKHPLERDIAREAGPVRVMGISTTVMNRETPRYSTSERLLGVALDHASVVLGAETRLLKLNDLAFRHCEGMITRRARSRARGRARLRRRMRQMRCSACMRRWSSGWT